MMMFDSMIESILMCEAEIWGWKKQEEAEKVQEKYLRGLLRMDRVMAGYIVRREECKRNRLRVKEGNFENGLAPTTRVFLLFHLFQKS
jgi:hypothetical protein